MIATIFTVIIFTLVYWGCYWGIVLWLIAKNKVQDLTTDQYLVPILIAWIGLIIVILR